MVFQKIIKVTFMCSTLLLGVTAEAKENNKEVPLEPLILKKESGFVLEQSAYSEEHNQVWYVAIDKSITSKDYKDFSISIIRYLDRNFALDEFNQLVKTKELQVATKPGGNIEFCLYYIHRPKGMSEDTLFVYFGFQGSYYMILGKQSLTSKAFDLSDYCDFSQ